LNKLKPFKSIFPLYPFVDTVKSLPKIKFKLIVCGKDELIEELTISGDPLKAPLGLPVNVREFISRLE
jgi:hypothetical protein